MWKRVFGDKWQQAKDLFAQLTPSQRLTATILAVTVFLGLLLIAFFSGGGNYVALARHKNVTELQNMAMRLREAGYGVRITGGTLEVKEKQLPRALSYVAGEVSTTPRRDGWSWLDKESSWYESSMRISQTILRAKTINLEESIKICPDVADSIVELNIKKQGLTVIGRNESQNSASVTLTLMPGVGRLKSDQIRVIRNIVGGGSPIPLRNVSVTDNHLHEYPLEEIEAGGGGSFDERRQSHIRDYRKRIASYVERTFRTPEYSLFVDVKISRERVTSDSEKIEPPKKPVLKREMIEKKKGRRDIGGGAPGTKTNASGRVYAPGERPEQGASGEIVTVDTEELDRTDREYDSRVSVMREARSNPAGAIDKISVALRLDKPALERVVSKLHGIASTAGDGKSKGKSVQVLEGAVKQYVTDCAEEISKMLALHGTPEVTVRPDVLLADPVGTVERIAEVGGIAAWAKENALLLTLAVLGFAALGFAYTLARRAIPPPIEIPPVVLPDEEVLFREPDADEMDADAIPELRLDDEEFVDSVKEIEGVAQEQPNVAAAVVKMWLGSQESAPRKKA